MKELSKLKIIFRNNIKNVLNERELLSKLDHPFLIKMHFSFQDKDNLYYILDFKECCDLRYYYSIDIKFNEEQSRFIISCLILSLEYIHTNKIVHKDLKPENLIFDKNGYLYLTDFGIAKYIENGNDIDMDENGSPGYISPEILLKKRYNFTADYFAVGIILYELMLLSRPYFGNRKKIKKQIEDEEKQININDIPQGWSVEACDLINKLILLNPDKRLGNKGINEIKNHPFFKYYDWKSVYLKKIESPFIPSPIKVNLEESLEEDISEISNYYQNKYNLILNSADYNYKFDGFLYFNRYIKKNKSNTNIYKSIEKEFINPHQIYEDIDKKETKFFEELRKTDKKQKSQKKLHRKIFSAEMKENKKKLFTEVKEKSKKNFRDIFSSGKEQNMKMIRVNRANNLKSIKKNNNNDENDINAKNKKLIEVNRKKLFSQ